MITQKTRDNIEWMNAEVQRMRPPRPTPAPARSITPAPVTLPLADVRRNNAVRERLLHALRVADTLGALRTYVVQLADDLLQPGALDPEPEELAAETMRSYCPPWDEIAPGTPRDSAAGKEFGV